MERSTGDRADTDGDRGSGDGVVLSDVELPYLGNYFLRGFGFSYIVYHLL